MQKIILNTIDARFAIHSIRHNSTRVKVFLGTDPSGRTVLVLVTDGLEPFFENMARFAGEEESEALPTVLAWFPPRVVSGQRIPADRPLASFFPGTGRGEDRFGVLVLELVRGEPLVERLVRSSIPKRIELLLELSRLLEDLDRREVWRCALRADHILVDARTAELRISAHLSIDGAKSVGVSHLHLFCNRFLPLLPRLSPGLNRICRRVNETDAVLENGFEAIRRELRALRRSESKAQAWLPRGWLRPAHLAGCVLAAWLCFVSVATLQGEGEPLPRKRALIVDNPKIAAPAKIEALHELLKETPDARFRKLLIEDIAGLSRDTFPVKELVGDDAKRPIAVLAFDRNPLVVAREEVLRLGDWVRIGSRFGFLAAIEFNRLRLEYETAYSWHYFDRPGFLTGMAANQPSVIVWHNPGNLHRFASVIAAFKGLAFFDENEYQTGATVLPAEIQGLFLANDFDGLLRDLCRLAPLAEEDGRLVLKRYREEIPVYFTIRNSFSFAVSDFAEWLSRMFGLPVAVEPAIAQDLIQFSFQNYPWQDALALLHLELSTVSSPSQGEVSLFLQQSKTYRQQQKELQHEKADMSGNHFGFRMFSSL